MTSSRMLCLLSMPGLAFAFLPALLAAESLDGVPVEVLARRQVVQTGRTLVYLRIRPPSLPAGSPSAPAAAPSAEEQQAEARRDAKAQISLGIAATVYAGSPTVTELSWTRTDGRVFRAFSNVDFTHLAQFIAWESATTAYEWMPLVSDGDPAALPAGVRAALTAGESGVHYIFEGDETEAQAEAGTLQALDYLHAYYQMNEAALVAATALREAEAAERARLAALAAARPKTETVFFWKIENPGSL